MRIFYKSEGPVETLLQISQQPVEDGDLISKDRRDSFVELGWVARCHGYNIITPAGRDVIRALTLCRGGD